MRIFITGTSGLLGLNAALQLKDRHEVSGAYLTHPISIEGVHAVRLDLTDAVAVAAELSAIRPEVVLHTAGLTNVDACEEHPADAERVHVRASEHIARTARAIRARLVHISTDHLSDGTKSFVNEQTCPSPVNHYARTKWLAEQAVAAICPNGLIVRTNFFGWGTSVKPSFSDWILNGLREGKSLPLFVDVHVTPILLNILVEVIEKLLLEGATGIFDVAGRDRVSKYDFGVKLAKTFGHSIENLRPVSVREARLRAPRPMDMSLSTDKVSAVLGHAMPSTNESLARLKTLGEQGWPDRIRQAMGPTQETRHR